MNTTIVLSAGHSALRSGASSGGHKEHTLNLRAREALRNALLDQGYNVVMIDPMTSLASRVKWIQENFTNSLAIEIHHNVFNSNASGAEVFYSAGDKQSFDIGSKSLRDSCEKLGLKCRGMKLAAHSARGSLAWMKVPHGLLWEVCFMDNPEDLSLVLGDNYGLWSETIASSLLPLLPLGWPKDTT